MYLFGVLISRDDTKSSSEIIFSEEMSYYYHIIIIILLPDHFHFVIRAYSFDIIENRRVRESEHTVLSSSNVNVRIRNIDAFVS